jgi:hypothetical protein
MISYDGETFKNAAEAYANAVGSKPITPLAQARALGQSCLARYERGFESNQQFAAILRSPKRPDTTIPIRIDGIAGSLEEGRGVFTIIRGLSLGKETDLAERSSLRLLQASVGFCREDERVPEYSPRLHYVAVPAADGARQAAGISPEAVEAAMRFTGQVTGYVPFWRPQEWDERTTDITVKALDQTIERWTVLRTTLIAVAQDQNLNPHLSPGVIEQLANFK